MKTLALTLLITLSVISMTPSSHAQRSGNQRYEEPSRFPVLRKAFRQVRSDIRYHAGAIRDTASDIRHDVSSSIRGEQRPNNYGYRHDTALPPRSSDRYEDHHYEEPAPTKRNTPPRRTVSKRLPSEEFTPRRERNTTNEPKIVAPKNLPKPRTKKPAPRSQPKPEKKPRLEPQPAPKKVAPKIDPAPPAKKKTTPKPEQQPKPESQPDPKPMIEPSPKTENKPAVGKIEYPNAKLSNRPGFHYSPFEPYELLDTQGIAPGELARDPGNGKIFRIPK